MEALPDSGTALMTPTWLETGPSQDEADPIRILASEHSTPQGTASGTLHDVFLHFATLLHHALSASKKATLPRVVIHMCSSNDDGELAATCALESPQATYSWTNLKGRCLLVLLVWKTCGCGSARGCK